jgi:hypothetical protein
MAVSNSILHTRPLCVTIGYLTIANTGPMSDWSVRFDWSWLSGIVSPWYWGVVHLLILPGQSLVRLTCIIAFSLLLHCYAGVQVSLVHLGGDPVPIDCCLNPF